MRIARKGAVLAGRAGRGCAHYTRALECLMAHELCCWEMSPMQHSHAFFHLVASSMCESSSTLQCIQISLTDTTSMAHVRSPASARRGNSLGSLLQQRPRTQVVAIPYEIQHAAIAQGVNHLVANVQTPVARQPHAYNRGYCFYAVCALSLSAPHRQPRHRQASIRQASVACAIV